MSKGFSMVGLATRAGKTVAGEFSVEKAVKQQKAKLVIVSQEASDNTKKLFKNKCSYYKIPCIISGSRRELGEATGKKERMSIAVLDEAFSKSIIQIFNGQ